MPSSTVRTFTDPADYAAAIRATRAELTVLGRGSFAGKLTRIDLHHLWMQRFSDNLPRIAHSAAMTGRAIISFRTEPGPDLGWGGMTCSPTNIMRHSEGENSLSAFFRVSLLGRHVAADRGNGFRWSGGCRMRPDATCRHVDRHSPTIRDGEAPAAARGCRATGGRRPCGHRPSRGGARSRTGVDRGHGRLSRHRRGSRGQVGAAAARVDPASVPQGDGGKSRSSTLYTGALYGDRGVGPDIAGMLPGAAGDEP